MSMVITLKERYRNLGWNLVFAEDEKNAKEDLEKQEIKQQDNNKKSPT